MLINFPLCASSDYRPVQQNELPLQAQNLDSDSTALRPNGLLRVRNQLCILAVPPLYGLPFAYTCCLGAVLCRLTLAQYALLRVWFSEPWT